MSKLRKMGLTNFLPIVNQVIEGFVEPTKLGSVKPSWTPDGSSRTWVEKPGDEATCPDHFDERGLHPVHFVHPLRKGEIVG